MLISEFSKFQNLQGSILRSKTNGASSLYIVAALLNLKKKLTFLNWQYFETHLVISWGPPASRPVGLWRTIRRRTRHSRSVCPAGSRRRRVWTVCWFGHLKLTNRNELHVYSRLNLFSHTLLSNHFINDLMCSIYQAKHIFILFWPID